MAQSHSFRDFDLANAPGIADWNVVEKALVVAMQACVETDRQLLG